MNDVLLAPQERMTLIRSGTELISLLIVVVVVVVVIGVNSSKHPGRRDDVVSNRT